MRPQPHTAAAGHVITMQDHLWVHRRTQDRAYAVWISSGCRSGTALRDWLQAEAEVLIEFCRLHVRPAGRCSAARRTRKKSAVGAASNRRTAAVSSQTEGLSQLPQGKDLRDYPLTASNCVRPPPREGTRPTNARCRPGPLSRRLPMRIRYLPSRDNPEDL
jgi:hypothetical protein